MWTKTNIAAVRTEKNVIASALLYMDLLHGVCVMNSMAERSVPEWLMPIQKMKLARYITEGSVLSSSRSLYLLGLFASFETMLFESGRSPNESAPVGQDCAHAGMTSPSFSVLSSSFALSLAALIL